MSKLRAKVRSGNRRSRGRKPRVTFTGGKAWRALGATRSTIRTRLLHSSKVYERLAQAVDAYFEDFGDGYDTGAFVEFALCALLPDARVDDALKAILERRKALFAPARSSKVR